MAADSLAVSLHEALRARGLRMAAAESCTGGLIALRLTTPHGASDVFVASAVTYSNQSKIALAHVPAGLIQSHGAVSPEVARAMAEGIASVTGAEVAVSTTGNLGPDPMEGKPAGLIHCAVFVRGKVEVREFGIKGAREEIRREAAEQALAFTLEMVLAWA
jgi:nicotinamide-nucleotide amidase